MREREGGELLREEAMEGGRDGDGDGERDGDRDRERERERERDPTKTTTCFRDLTFAERTPPSEKCAAPPSNKIWEEVRLNLASVLVIQSSCWVGREGGIHK